MTKIKTIFYLLLVCFHVQNTQAQKEAVSSGGNAIGAGGTVSYSVGQVGYATATGVGGKSTQGVQQSFEIATLGKDNFPDITLQMMVYPNPTTAMLNLIIKKNNFENLHLHLFDLTGKKIQSQKISAQETSIQMENLPNAIYILHVNDNNNTVKTFKITKN